MSSLPPIQPFYLKGWRVQVVFCNRELNFSPVDAIDLSHALGGDPRFGIDGATMMRWKRGSSDELGVYCWSFTETEAERMFDLLVQRGLARGWHVNYRESQVHQQTMLVMASLSLTEQLRSLLASEDLDSMVELLSHFGRV